MRSANRAVAKGHPCRPNPLNPRRCGLFVHRSAKRKSLTPVRPAPPLPPGAEGRGEAPIARGEAAAAAQGAAELAGPVAAAAAAVQDDNDAAAAAALAAEEAAADEDDAAEDNLGAMGLSMARGGVVASAPARLTAWSPPWPSPVPLRMLQRRVLRHSWPLPASDPSPSADDARNADDHDVQQGNAVWHLHSFSFFFSHNGQHCSFFQCRACCSSALLLSYERGDASDNLARLSHFRP